MTGSRKSAARAPAAADTVEGLGVGVDIGHMTIGDGQAGALHAAAVEATTRVGTHTYEKGTQALGWR